METIPVENNTRVLRLEAIGRFAFYGLAFLLPLWVLPITAFPFLVNKVFLAYALILIALICWLLTRMRAGSLELPKNFLAASLVLFALSVLLSGVFSESRHISFRVLSGDPAGGVALGFFVIAAFLAAAYFKEEKTVFTWFLAFFASATALFVFQAAKIAFSSNPIPQWFDLPFATSNLFGTWTEFGILFSLAGFAALFLFEVVPLKKFRIFFGFVVAAAFLTLIAANVRVIWWTMFASLIVLFAYLFSIRILEKNFFRPTLFLLIAVLVSVQAPTFVSIISGRLGTQPVEVRPSFEATLETVKGAILAHPVFGSGPGTFVYNWVQHRPLEVNASPFWSVRFTAGAGFLLSLVSAIGFAGGAALLAVMAAFFWYGIRVFRSPVRSGPNSFLALTFFLALMAGAYAGAYNPGFVLTLYLFIFIGMFMGLLETHNFTDRFSIKLFANSGASFMTALSVIAVLIGAVSASYVLAERYVAAYHYGAGVLSMNRANDAANAALSISRATEWDGADFYYRGLAGVKLAELSRILNASEPPESLQARFQAVASEAIEAAQTATKVNGIDSENWNALARIYEALLPLGISGVSNAALAAYGEEALRDPSSPEPILAEARIFKEAGDTEKARERAETALALKSNYVPAHLFIAQLEEESGNIQGAIERMQKAALLNPTEVGTLFQLGLLYYRSEQLENAGRLFQRAVELSPTYSNARYFLGLVYDRLGEKAAALEQFQRVLIFNPENAEVKQIIGNLESGKRALAGISSPEDRDRAPIDE
ncbi:MAG: tetratricopeptide repeat protein [Candidatus Niyogibacteria bacterium]|nr:tetratricopeptide repeat protein [Candidatus Niyogibacteria bacterium]